MTKPVVISFGRSAAITQGHHENFMFGKRLADKHNADYHIHLSQSFDHTKNPLTHDDKLDLAKKMMPHLSEHFRTDKDVKTIFHALKKYSGEPGTNKDCHVIVGADRKDEFSQLVNKYNGKDFHFRNIYCHSSGDRVEGVSGTDMRKHAVNNDFESFKNGIPNTGKPEHAKEMFDKIREVMLNPPPPKKRGKKTIKESLIPSLTTLILEVKDEKKKKLDRANNKWQINPIMSDYQTAGRKTHAASDLNQPGSQINES